MNPIFDSVGWPPVLSGWTDAAMKSVVVLLVTALVVFCMKRRSAAARHLVWFLSLASLLVMPVLSWVLPGWRILPRWSQAPVSARAEFVVPVLAPPLPTPSSPQAQWTAVPNGRVPFPAPGSVGPDPLPSVRVESSPIQTAQPEPWFHKLTAWQWGLSVWLVGVMLALVPTLMGNLALWRLGRSARPETAGSWLELLRHLIGSLNIRRRVLLLKSERRRMPMTWGFLRPRLLLPMESQAWPEEQRRIVLLHELAHVRRWDYLTHLVTQLVCALYWFNPLVWFAARQMVAERERACDDIVLRHGAQPADYAGQLLEIAAHLPIGHLARMSTIPMARPTKLEGRLRAILDAKRNRAAVTRLTVLATLALMAVIVVPVAVMRAAPSDSGDGNSPRGASSTDSDTTAGLAAAADLEDTPISERKVTLSVEQEPLKDVLREICRQARTELELDEEGLKSSGVSVDTPITLKCQDEGLRYAVARIIWFLDRQGMNDITQNTRSGKLIFSSIRGRRTRLEQAQPDWLKGYGFAVAVDNQTNIVSVSVGANADDALLARLKTLPALRDLDIQATKTITPAGLAHLAELPALEKLNLYIVNEGGDGLGDVALKAISRSKTLRDLGVSQSDVSDEGARYLAGMTQLTALNLSGNALTDAGVKHLAGLTNLQQLDLSQSMWFRSRMVITDEGMKSLSNMTQLRSLSIGRLVGITDAGLKHLSGLTNLRSFAFAGTAVTTWNLPFPGMQTLELSGSQVTDATLDNIAQYRDLRNLTLQYTGVTDAGMERLASLKELRRLTLDSHQITDAGIAQLRTLTKLEHVELRADGVSDKSLASLAQIKSLTRLDLYGSGQGGVSPGRVFTMDGLLQLKALPSLRELWINNLVLPEGYLGLRELKQLRSITLFFCNVSEAEEELLKAAMPDSSVSAVSGGGKVVMGTPKQPVSLPDVAVRVTGHAVDDESGQPVQNCTLEFGKENPDRRGEFIWGEALPGGRMEVTGNDPQDRSHFWGESFRPGIVWARLLASGYQPTLLTVYPVSAPWHLTNLVVRMQRGGEFHGVVLDHTGKPAPGIRVYLADKPSFYLRDGVDNSSTKADLGVTDANGRFTVSGGNGTPQRLLAASADGRLFQIKPRAELNQEIKLTMPQPATLVLRFDVPDDSAVAECFLNFDSQKTDPAIWKDTSFGVSPIVTNRSDLVLTNLSPGHYTFARRKMLHVGSGRRYQFLDNADLQLKAGETQRVDMVRPVGQTIRGQVTGIEEAQALGAYLYACVGEITNSPISSWNPGPLIDLGTCGKDGVFQMARFPPGIYSIVAMAYKEPNVYSHSGEADFIGVAKVTVTADKPPEPVTIPLQVRK